MQGSLLYQHGSNRALALVKLCLDNQTSRPAVRVGLQLQNLRCQQNHFQQVIDTLMGMGGYRAENGAAAPVLGNQLILGQLLLYTLDISAGLIDLIDGNDDLDACGLGMVNSLNGLGHYAVVGCNYQDGDIGGVSSTHTHGGERLMSRCVQEGDLLTVDAYHVSTDVLGDSACLAVNDMGVTDGIQQGSLTMVYMTHNADYRRTGYECLIAVFRILQHLRDDVFLLLGNRIEIHFHSQLACSLKVQFGVYGYHLACQEQLLDDHGRLNLHLLRQIMDADHLRNFDNLGGVVFFLRRRCRLTSLSSALTSLAALLIRTVTALVRTTSALTRLAIPAIIELCVLIFLGIIIAILILRSAVLVLTKLYRC